ncbi:MAG TPA: HNH endonuclease signature motif containing protein [Thermoguttaceae bacterium]
MTKIRGVIPKAVKEQVLDEYKHRCAICNGDRPQLHHIDENPSNNNVINLIPLCPNCHLRDQHNPTAGIDIGRIELFRKYKDPIILSSQFYPLYKRFMYFYNIKDDAYCNVLDKQAIELIGFVGALKMGNFYGKQLEELIVSPARGLAITFGEPNAVYTGRVEEHRQECIAKLRRNVGSAESLLIELLRYQDWKYNAG